MPPTKKSNSKGLKSRAKGSHTFNFFNDTMDVVERTGFNQTQAFERGILAYDHLRKLTLQEIKGLFTDDELYSLVQINRNSSPPIHFQGFLKNYVNFIRESYEYDRSTFLDVEKVIKKLSKLSAAQIFFLREEIFRCTNSKKYNLGNLTSTLLKDPK